MRVAVTDGGVNCSAWVDGEVATTEMMRKPRFRFLFTRDEYVLAHVQVMPREEAEARARALYSQDDSEAIGVHVADGDLLLLALLSEELAARVIAYRPTLRTQVERFRANREAALESWRAALEKP